MADNLLISLVIRAINKASAPLRQVAKDINAVSERTAYLRQAAGTLARIGVASVGAGAAIGYGLAKITGPAQEVQEQLHRLANTLPGGAEGIKELGQAEAATAQWSTKLGIAQEGLLKQVYLGTSAGLSMADSIKAMAVASQLAQGNGGDLEATQRTLNLAYINFKDPSKSASENIQNLGDIMATATAKFDYKQVEELRSQIELATPTALAAGTSFKDMTAALADFTRHGLTGSIAGAAFEESLQGVLKMQEKLGIPIAHNAKGGLDYVRSLENIRSHFIQLYGSMQAIPVPVLDELRKTFGIRGIRALLIQKDEIDQMRESLDNSTGAVQRQSAEMLKSPQEQFAVLGQNLRQVAIQIGDAILPAMVSLGQAILPVAKAAAAFVQTHQGFVKIAAIIFAISAAVLVVVGGLALATSAILGFAAILPMLGVFAGLLGSISGITAVWTAAQWALNAALDANPLGIMIVSAAALAFAIVEVIKHWQAIKDFMLALPATAMDVGKRILDALIRPFLDLPQHIRNAIGDIKSAVGDVAGAIGRFFIGHSPIPEGPLHDLNLGRDIGRSLTPSPILTALRTTAAAVAFAAPLALAPAMAGGAMSGGTSNGGAAITVRYSPVVHIDGASGDGKAMADQVMAVLKGHSGDLVKIIQREIERKLRLQY